MAAVALGFGLFVGVAIGPGTQGSLGTTKPMVVQVPAPNDGTDDRGRRLAAGEPDRRRRGAWARSRRATRRCPRSTHRDTPRRRRPTRRRRRPRYTPPPITTPSYTPPPIDGHDDDHGHHDRPDDDHSAEDTTTELAGTVVHLNPKAGSYTIAVRRSA